MKSLQVNLEKGGLAFVYDEESRRLIEKTGEVSLGGVERQVFWYGLEGNCLFVRVSTSSIVVQRVDFSNSPESWSRPLVGAEIPSWIHLNLLEFFPE